MRSLVMSAVVICAVAVVAGSSYRSGRSQSVLGEDGAPVPRTPAGPRGDELIVHEWGTFTSFSGSDGVRLEFRPLLDEDLPPFVLDRFLQSGMVNPFLKSQVRSRIRMETPVTYFYTNRERDVNVRVRFPEGLLTEFYPPVAAMEPAYQLGEQLSLRQSSLNWGHVHLIPTDRLQARVDDPQLRTVLESLLRTGVPPVADPKYHYGHARETDSALVHVHRPKTQSEAAPLTPAGDFFEKFLFYRGVGNFELPLTLTAAADGTFQLANSGQDAIGSLFLIEVGERTIRFARFEEVAAGSRAALRLPREESTIDALAAAVEQALVEQGLYEKEAAAMVKTWRSSWFGEHGTRLLYVVPPSVTDELLPLEISPAPEETVRVLVGRMEIMSREEESRIEGIVRRSAAERAARLQAAGSDASKLKYAGPPELETLGRLAEPALARVLAISSDATLRGEARTLLRQMVRRGE